MKGTNYYDTELTLAEEQKLQYLFASEGKSTIIKAIEYSPITEINGRKIYNLGFGDYDEESKTIIDDSNSNNGDMYTVFNTVLYSIPEFFTSNPNDVLYVTGSDSMEEYRDFCIKTCKKPDRCQDICRKEDRRIKTYCNYVDKNFEELSTEYIFFGKNKTIHDKFVQYVPWQEYHEIMVYKIN